MQPPCRDPVTAEGTTGGERVGTQRTEAVGSVEMAMRRALRRSREVPAIQRIDSAGRAEGVEDLVDECIDVGLAGGAAEEESE